MLGIINQTLIQENHIGSPAIDIHTIKKEMIFWSAAVKYMKDLTKRQMSVFLNEYAC